MTNDRRPAGVPEPLGLSGLLALDREGFLEYYRAGGDMSALTPFTAAWRDTADDTMRVITVRLPRILLGRLDKLVGARNREGRSGLIRTAIEEYLHRLESGL